MSGSSTNRATKVARFSRRNDSHTPNSVSAPCHMIFSWRPECVAAVEGVRQLQDVLEIPAHRGQPTALGEAVGVQRDQDAGADAAHADQAP